jgi:hypothetical protein
MPSHLRWHSQFGERGWIEPVQRWEFGRQSSQVAGKSMKRGRTAAGTHSNARALLGIVNQDQTLDADFASSWRR